MAVITEFWTNGNLVINNTGGINFNILDRKKSWEVQTISRNLILNEELAGYNCIKFYPLLSFKIREDKIQEVIDFLGRHEIKHRVVEE